ncbi:MAG TPA: hypothetical protein VI504_02270 [Candidatus Eisenbacteria bacterium]|jgi:hypothetical protein
MITSNPGTHGTQAAPAETPEILADPTPALEPSAAPVGPTRPTRVALATTRAATAAAAAASQVARGANRAAPPMVATPYRAVFACAMQAQGAPEEA